MESKNQVSTDITEDPDAIHEYKKAKQVVNLMEIAIDYEKAIRIEKTKVRKNLAILFQIPTW